MRSSHLLPASLTSFKRQASLTSWPNGVGLPINSIRVYRKHPLKYWNLLAYLWMRFLGEARGLRFLISPQKAKVLISSLNPRQNLSLSIQCFVIAPFPSFSGLSEATVSIFCDLFLGLR